MIWKQPLSVEMLNNIHKKTLASHLGIKITEIGEDYMKATMPVDDRTQQPVGLLHGGASAALVETMGGIAGWMCLDDIDQFSVVGIEVSANHLRSVRDGKVTAIARPVKLGRRIQVWEVQIFQGRDLICKGNLTGMVVKK